MNRDLKNRVRRLESRLQVGMWLTLYEHDHAFATMKGSADEFFRILEHGLLDKAPNGERQALAQMCLTDLRRATRMEGHNVQLFGLLQALALGPVDPETTTTNPKENANG